MKVDYPFKKDSANYVQILTSNLEDQFDEVSMKMLNNMDTLLNPTHLNQSSSDIVSHGVKALSQIIEHYGHECKGELRTFPQLINSEHTKHDFTGFKSLLKSLPAKTLQTVSKYLLTVPLKDIYPDLATIAGIMIYSPITLVECEGGFSAQNCMKTNHGHGWARQNWILI